MADETDTKWFETTDELEAAISVLYRRSLGSDEEGLCNAAREHLALARAALQSARAHAALATYMQATALSGGAR